MELSDAWIRFGSMFLGAICGHVIYELCFRRNRVDRDELRRWQQLQESFNEAICADYQKAEQHVNHMVSCVNNSLREMRKIIDEQLGDTT